ncbi:MAG: hypothetical protein KDK99_20245, partial [Verrucomicrobiales bacterium]|nr:hypothetical protein [Verrucomicrobiales bacterium]
GWVADSFHDEIPDWGRQVLAVCLMLGVTWSGLRTWREESHFHGYQDSALRPDFNPAGGGGVVVEMYAHRITGPAYLLGQVILAGPLLLMRAVGRLRNWIAPSPELERDLKEMLETLRKVDRWQEITDYPGRERLILLLAQMGKIDMSRLRGVPRFKAN